MQTFDHFCDISTIVLIILVYLGTFLYLVCGFHFRLPRRFRPDTTFQRQLRAIGACPAAIDWVGRRTFRQAWEECDNPQWMMWFLRMGLYIPGSDQAFWAEICQFFWQHWYIFQKLETAEERCRFIRENYPLKRFQEQFERAVAHNRAEHPE